MSINLSPLPVTFTAYVEINVKFIPFEAREDIVGYNLKNGKNSIRRI